MAESLDSVPRWGDSDGSHFLTGLEPGVAGIQALLALAAVARTEAATLAEVAPLRGRVVAGMFFDPSLRTRASLAVACARLGATFLDLHPSSDLWTLEFNDKVIMDGTAQEHIREAGGVLGRYADLVGLRAFPTRGQWDRERTQPIHRAFAATCGVPVVNLEGPFAHPCQGLADALTLRDLLVEPQGKKLTLCWTPHPGQLSVSVPHSTLWAAAGLGMDIALACPEGFELDPGGMEQAEALASETGGRVQLCHDRDRALDGAQVVYARSWGALTGPEASLAGHADAVSAHRDWTVTSADLEEATAFLHCLPVRRGVAVADSVLDGPKSKVLDLAENRVWTEIALLLALLRGEG